ncbi:transposable element Tcb1 transposase [Trichonephila clavipes]|nr:transposable element Tcb1 transposase [Trichonephila clavipes]
MNDFTNQKHLACEAERESGHRVRQVYENRYPDRRIPQHQMFASAQPFDQVSEFDRGRIVAYRDCGLSFREIGIRVERNQTTVMRICDRWMQEGTTDRRGRSHPPQCTTSRDDRQIVRMAVTDRSVTSRTVAQHIEFVTHH